ncbi:MAG: hypothetical protein BRC29_01075 [Nanohaloarchaea archaeon SW_7_43_1]|nr:MAG: hypothetical protein BRC29_01075 [Nanohaloarchaea archaeon SW_7_43_1]
MTDDNWDSIDSELEPSPADEREEAYRERKEAERRHEEAQDEGIMANRRDVLKLGAATAATAGGGILYGILDQSDNDLEESKEHPSHDSEYTPTGTEKDTTTTGGPVVYENVDQFNDDVGTNLVYEEIEAFADTSGYKDAENFDLQYDSKTGDLTVLTEDGERIGTYPEEFK